MTILAKRLRTAVAGLALAGTFAAGAALAHPGLHHDIERLTAAIAAEPGKAALYIERAYFRRLNQELPEALADLDIARKLEPASVHVAVERGLTLSAMGRDREAEAELDLSLRDGEGSAAAFAERARIRERTGRKEPAVLDYGAALKLRPDVELYILRGRLQEELGDRAGAAAGYRDGLSQLGGAVTLRLALVRVETARRNFDAALALLDVPLARAGVKTEWLLRRGDVLQAAGRNEEARAERERALDVANRTLERSSTGIHLLSRARAHLALGNVEDARRDLELALSRTPRFPEAGELLARIGTAKHDK